MLEVLAERFDRVQVVFAQREGAGSGGCPGIHQSHLQDIVKFGRIADERAAIADVKMDFWNLVKVISIVRVTVPHDVIGDKGIDFDPRDCRAAVGNGAQHVNTATRTDDGELTLRAQHVDHCRRCTHQIVLPRRSCPSMGIHVHDRGAGVSIDDDVLGAISIAVDFYSRDGIPANVFHSCGAVVPPSLRVDHVD